MLTKIDIRDFMTPDENPTLDCTKIDLIEESQYPELAKQLGKTTESLKKAIEYCKLSRD